MICFFDLVFIKKMMFYKTNKSHNLIFVLLLINYLVLYLFVDNASLSYVGIPSLVIIASSSISWYLNPESVTSVVSTTLPVLLLYIFPIATPSLYN
jgi:hypothetical protein